MTTGTSVHTPPSLQGSEEVLWQYGSWSPLHSQKFFLVTGSKLSYLRVKLFGGSIKSFANVSLYKLRFLSGRIHAGIKIISHIQYLQGKQESRQRWFKDPGGRAVGTGEGVDSLHGWPVHLSHIHSPTWVSLRSLILLHEVLQELTRSGFLWLDFHRFLWVTLH